MAHILILNSKQNIDFTKLMVRTAVDVLTADGHTYDEIQVSSIKELPIALNLFAESNYYEATICLGIVHPSPMEDSKLHYQEVLRCIYDYSTYFGHLVGKALIYCESPNTTENNLINYTQEVVSGICDFIKLSREINSMEGIQYGNTRQHN